MNTPTIPKPKPKSKKQLTQWECIQLYCHTRLGAVGHELRNQGYPIITHMQKNANDNGTHAKYVLRGVSHG